jgi:hypothetical protein
MKTKSVLLAILAVSQASSLAGLVLVSGTANPWLAGMTNGSTDRSGSDVDSAPTNSPVLAPGMALLPGMTLSFTVSGGVSRSSETNFYPIQTPDGAQSITYHWAGAVNGIATLTAPYESLIGVFLGPGEPDLSPAPAGLDFATAASRYSLLIQPGLKEPFFIGDGLSTNGLVQSFTVPNGATRLFLGAMDAEGWYNNVGQFSVLVKAPIFLTIQNSCGYAGITVGGPVGSTNLIQYITNLGDTNWLTLTNVVLSSAPSFFIDTESSITGQCFYRAVRNE